MSAKPTVDELRIQLEALGLPSNGRKAELLERLEGASIPGPSTSRPSRRSRALKDPVPLRRYMAHQRSRVSQEAGPSEQPVAIEPNISGPQQLLNPDITELLASKLINPSDNFTKIFDKAYVLYLSGVITAKQLKNVTEPYFIPTYIEWGGINKKNVKQSVNNIHQFNTKMEEILTDDYVNNIFNLTLKKDNLEVTVKNNVSSTNPNNGIFTVDIKLTLPNRAGTYSFTLNSWTPLKTNKKKVPFNNINLRCPAVSEITHLESLAEILLGLSWVQKYVLKGKGKLMIVEDINKIFKYTKGYISVSPPYDESIEKFLVSLTKILPTLKGI